MSVEYEFTFAVANDLERGTLTRDIRVVFSNGCGGEVVSV
jgi:hypothetical protein